MSVRIEATYPATDGAAPENVSIEWSDETPPPTAVDLCALINALADVPRRYVPPDVTS